MLLFKLAFVALVSDSNLRDWRKCFELDPNFCACCASTFSPSLDNLGFFNAGLNRHLQGVVRLEHPRLREQRPTVASKFLHTAGDSISRMWVGNNLIKNPAVKKNMSHPKSLADTGKLLVLLIMGQGRPLSHWALSNTNLELELL